MTKISALQATIETLKKQLTRADNKADRRLKLLREANEYFKSMGECGSCGIMEYDNNNVPSHSFDCELAKELQKED